MTYELHSLCKLFPRLSGAEFDALRDDIKANGLCQPIVVYEGMILDGGNRYRACLEAGVQPVFEDFAGSNLVGFVLSANLQRRHLSPGQQAAIVASAQDWAKAQPVGGCGANQHRSKPATLPDSSPRLDTVATRSAQSGASERTQRMADKVAKTDPELAKKVAHGEISLSKAVAQVAKSNAPSSCTRAPDADDNSPNLDELIDELKRENESLQAQVAAIRADDQKAETLKWRKAYEHAARQQSEAMDRAKRSHDREKWSRRQLMRCGKSVGEDDPDKIAPAVEAFARQFIKAA